MEVRQISNRKNKICLCVGIGMCIISVIEMLLIKFYFKSKWPGQNVDLFFLWLGIIGILMILIAGVLTEIITQAACTIFQIVHHKRTATIGIVDCLDQPVSGFRMQLVKP